MGSINTFGSPLFGQVVGGQQQPGNPYGVSRTYGQLRSQLAEEYPGTSLDLLDAHITNRFHTIIQRLDWQELEQTTTMQTVAPFTAGLVTFTPGNTVVTLQGAAWGAAQNGLLIRASGDLPMYTLTVQGPNNGILDRPYNGFASATVPSGYQVVCPLYGLPTLVRAILRMEMVSYNYPLKAASQEYLDQLDSSRVVMAPPQFWAPAPPRGIGQPFSPLLELYPIPDNIYDIQLTFLSDFSTFGPNDTQLFFPKMLDLQCILAGVRADLTIKDIAASLMHERLFEKRLADMMVTDSRRKPLERIQVADYKIAYRQERWIRSHGPGLYYDCFDGADADFIPNPPRT